MSREDRSDFYKGVLDKENGAECSFTALCVWDFLEFKCDPFDSRRKWDEHTGVTQLEKYIEKQRRSLGSGEFKSYVANLSVEIFEAEQLIGGYDHEALDMAYDCEWIPHLFETWFEETGQLIPSDSGTRHWVKQQYHAQAVKTKLKNAQH